MRLAVDLRRDAPSPPVIDDVRPLDPHLVAAAMRSPGRLRDLLRDRPYTELDVRTGTEPLSGRQALVLCALAAARTRRFAADGRFMGRARFAAWALLAALRALGAELIGTMTMAAMVVIDERRCYRLPLSASMPRSALYLRVEPSLRWQGAQVGGAATHTSGVINGLIDSGVEVRVVAAERPVGTDRAAITAVRPRRIFDLIPGVGYAAYARSIARAARGFPADFVYERYQLGSAAGLRVARRLGVPLVLEFNGPEVWVERHWRGGSMLLGGPLQRLEQRNLCDASLVVVVSEALRDIAATQGVPPERVLVNPNGVDVDALAPYREGTPRTWRRHVGLPDRPTVGFVGTFGAWHGVELLPALVAAVPEAQWVLIGGGGLLPGVSAEIEQRGLGQRTILTGVIDHHHALELLAASDVCISPHVPNPDGSPFFGSPTKLFEYMGLARPIVASDLDQIGEVIEDGRSGLLCPPGDVAAAAAAVRRLLNDPALRDGLAAAALERAATQFSWRAHARRIVDALEDGSAAGVGSLAS